jgi:lipid-A-disaccharide synthase
MGALSERLRARGLNARYEGIGGAHMIDRGLTELYPMERLSVMGLFEAIGRFRELIPVRRRLAKAFAGKPPAVLIGIDAPDFNLALERAVKGAGVPTVHYVSPSVWAWRRYRLPKIRRSVNLMLTLLPFEAAFYRANDIPVQFVGHPFADEMALEPDRQGARETAGLPADARCVALLPGSRMAEVERVGPALLDIARWLLARDPELSFVTAHANARTEQLFTEQAKAQGVPVTVLGQGQARLAMVASDAVILASGTATLEAMLAKRPMVIGYRGNRVSYWILRRWLGRSIRFIGLPNLLAGRAVVPELLQDRLNAEVAGPLVMDMLTQGLSDELRHEFDKIHRTLRRGASDAAADAIMELLIRERRMEGVSA